MFCFVLKTGLVFTHPGVNLFTELLLRCESWGSIVNCIKGIKSFDTKGLLPNVLVFKSEVDTVQRSDILAVVGETN